MGVIPNSALDTFGDLDGLGHLDGLGGWFLIGSISMVRLGAPILLIGPSLGGSSAGLLTAGGSSSAAGGCALPSLAHPGHYSDPE